MDQQNKEKLINSIRDFLDENLSRMIVSNPVSKEGISKVKIRPILLRNSLGFQAEEQIGTQALWIGKSARCTLPAYCLAFCGRWKRRYRYFTGY